MVGRKGHAGVYLRGAHLRANLQGSLMGSLMGSLTGSLIPRVLGLDFCGG